MYTCVARVSHACRTRAFVKLPLSRTVYTVVSFPDAPPTRGKERLVTIDAKLGPNDVIYPAVVECAIIISWAFN